MGGLFTMFGGILMMVGMVAPLSSKPPIIGLSIACFVISIVIRLRSRSGATGGTNGRQSAGRDIPAVKVTAVSASSIPASTSAGNITPASSAASTTNVELGDEDDVWVDDDSHDGETKPAAEKEIPNSEPEPSKPVTRSVFKIVDCAHCGTRVSPKSDDTCPSCQEAIAPS